MYLFVLAINRVDILETSISESDIEVDVRKRKIPLRKHENKRSESNAFLNALNDSKIATTSKVLEREQSRSSDLYSSDIEILESERERNSRKNNPFQRKSLKHSTNRIVDTSETDTNKQIKAKRPWRLPSESDENGFLNVLTTPEAEQNLAFESDAVSKDNKIIQSDDDNKVLKLKTRFMRRMRKSTNKNTFEDVLSDNEDLNLSRNNNQNQKINIAEVNSLSSASPSLSYSFSKELVNRLDSNVTRENMNVTNTPIRKSPRLSFNATRSSRSSFNATSPKLSFNATRSQSSNFVVPQIEGNHIIQSNDLLKNNSIAKHASVNKSVSRTSVESHEPEEAMTVDDEDATRTAQTIQRNSPLENRRSTRTPVILKTSSRTSIVHSPNSASVKENRETTRSPGERSLRSSNRDTPIKASSMDVSFDTTPKIHSSKTSRTIKDFFKIRQSSAAINKRSNDQSLTSSHVFTDANQMEKIKEKLERIKNREMTAMRMYNDKKTNKKEFASNAKINAKFNSVAPKQTTKKSTNPIKTVDKAFLVNGKVYKAPRLPRPKHWVTDHLYKFLWKQIEPKYKLATRVQSEKFVQELAKIVSLIERRKKYDSYKTELKALMKEMARLQIISTRNDFYNFCRDFLPYEFRVKVVPMLLPGNNRIIPYDPEKLHILLLNE